MKADDAKTRLNRRSRLFAAAAVLLTAIGVAPMKSQVDPDLSRLQKIKGSTTGGAVLDTGEPGSFDAAWVTCPTVLWDGRRYRMWYSSLYDSKMGRGGIGLATSADGLNWVRENGGKPVLEIGPPGSFDDGQILAPATQFDGQVYRMWYTGMSVNWHSSGLGFYRIGLVTSRDGVHWTRENNGQPVLDIGSAGSYDEVQAATPSILRQGGSYRMWYAAWAPKSGHTICVAQSQDGIHWRRENNGKPVGGLSPAGAYGPAVHREGNQYFLLYMATGETYRGLYGAVSSDGLSWRMLGEGPLIPRGVRPDFDESLAGHPCLLRVQDRLRVWYTGYRREAGGVLGWKLRIGLAEFGVKP